MKARKLSYWFGLFCVAMLVLMPDITVNAQPPDPGGQGSNGQMASEVDQGTDTQASEGQLTSEEQQPPEEPQTSEEQGQREREDVEKSLLEAGCEPINSGTYDCPTGIRFEGVLSPLAGRETEQSLIEKGWRHTNTWTDPFYGGVYNEYHHDNPRIGRPIGFPGWLCLISPDRADQEFVLGGGIWAVGEIRRGECVLPPIGGGGIREPIRKGSSPREVGLEQIPEPATSGSQVQGDQQQPTGDQQQADEEAQTKDDRQQAEGNKASNDSRGNDETKKGYGCSASS